MKYYLVTAMKDGMNPEKLFLAYFDDGADLHYWTRVKHHSDVLRFEKIEDVRALIAARIEFNLIENNGISITLPLLLQSVNPQTIMIETEWIEEPCEAVNLTAVLNDYKSRKIAFETLYNQLKEI